MHESIANVDDAPAVNVPKIYISFLLKTHFIQNFIKAELKLVMLKKHIHFLNIFTIFYYFSTQLRFAEDRKKPMLANLQKLPSYTVCPPITENGL